jgi:hypothetical protein
MDFEQRVVSCYLEADARDWTELVKCTVNDFRAWTIVQRCTKKNSMSMKLYIATVGHNVRSMDLTS